MSTIAHPKVVVSDEHLIVSNSFSNEHPISSIEHDTIGNTTENSDEVDAHVLLKSSPDADSILLEDETLSVQITYPESITITKDKPTPTIHTSFNSDSHSSQTSSKVSSLFRHKDHHEASPLKEAIKGFVLSKLSKKAPTVSDTGHSGDIERRTIFSGIKEKFAKKLEDSTTKETPLLQSDVKLPEKSNIGVELRVDLVNKSECELKSVVANDKTEGYVEEAEECFEETKRTFKEQTLLSVNTDRYSFGDHSAPLGKKRSRSISNLTTTSYEMLKPDPIPDKTLSFSFSDLQRADDLGIDNVTESEFPNVPEVHLEPSIASNDSPAVDVNTDDHEDTNISEMSSPKTALSYFRTAVSSIGYFCSTVFKTSYGLTVISAILTYWLHWNNSPFVAGILCGMTVFTVVFLLLHEFTSTPKQDIPVHFPDYKTLPPLTIPVSPKVQVDNYEGWMNQLMGDYDQESFKLCNTVSVYIRLEEQMLHMCYPKKEVPKRAMWNEKLPQNNPFVRQEIHPLKGAKITLVPDNLLRTRVWCKRYPLRIILLKPSERQRSPSIDCSSLVEDKSPPTPTKPSSNGVQSLPASLSGSPIHNGADQNVIHLFARTDREKEEWYWRFYDAITERKRQNSCYIADDYFNLESIQSSSSTEQPLTTDSGKATSSTTKDDKPKSPLTKPILNFNTYMRYLLKDLPSAEDTKDAEVNSLQWLNVFLGRLFYDYLTQKKWCDNVQQRIQRKLSRLKMPPYMQELVVTDVYLGTSLPQIRRTSDPVLDERGLWLDLDIEYKGSFQMTLETKIKLQLQAKRDPADEGEKVEEQVVQPAPAISGEIIQLSEEFADLSDEDDDLPDSEASKEESSSKASTSVSTGARLLLTVERWVNSTNLAENKFVKKCVGHLTQTPLVLTVEMNALCGTLGLNIPPLETDRLWYGFRKNPELSITVCPKVGERHINYTPIVQYIKKKLILEFQKAVVMPNMDDFTVPFMHSTVYEE